MGRGNLFATGLVAGGALAGVIVAFLSANDAINTGLQKISAEHSLTTALGENGYFLVGVLLFAAMGFLLYRIGSRRV